MCAVYVSACKYCTVCDLCFDSIVSFDEKEYNEKLARTVAKGGGYCHF